MKRFAFRLETVLRWRRSQFDLEQSKLHKLVGEREVLRARIHELEGVRAAAEQAVLKAGEVRGEELAALEAYRRALAAQRANLQKALVACEEKIKAQRERVLEARRNVRLLEALKQRQRLAWEAELNRELEALAAEAYLGRWGRR